MMNIQSYKPFRVTVYVPVGTWIGRGTEISPGRRLLASQKCRLELEVESRPYPRRSDRVSLMPRAPRWSQRVTAIHRQHDVPMYLIDFIDNSLFPWINWIEPKRESLGRQLHSTANGTGDAQVTILQRRGKGSVLTMTDLRHLEHLRTTPLSWLGIKKKKVAWLFCSSHVGLEKNQERKKEPN